MLKGLHRGACLPEVREVQHQSVTISSGVEHDQQPQKTIFSRH